MSILLEPLFPVEDVRRMTAGRVQPVDAERRGHLSPVAAIYGFIDEQPTMAVELAFYPLGDAPELLTPESWLHYREMLGLAPFAGPSSLRGGLDDGWRIEFGPHALISNPARRFQFVVPRPDADWEEAVKANTSCCVVVGSGLGADDRTGAFGIPATAAALTAAYGGSWVVPDLVDIPGLYVVPLNSFRPYNPMAPVSFVLDADVLIALQRFCFAPKRLGERLEDIRHLAANLLGRDVLPGPALGQLHQPTSASEQPRSGLEARAAFDLLMNLSRAEIMDASRRPQRFDPSYQCAIQGATDLPQMLWMYAGVLRLRQLWNPNQSLPERARSFEKFMGWLREELRLNAALLVQVAFNLWIADEEAQKQAGAILHFRAKPVTDATLGELWGTAHDLFLLSGQVDATEVPDVVDAVILTFDAGVAGMRDFFEHVGVAEIASAIGAEPIGYFANSRVKANFHPRLEYMSARMAKLAAGLHADMFARLEAGDMGAYDMIRLRALVEQEEQLVKELG